MFELFIYHFSTRHARKVYDGLKEEGATASKLMKVHCIAKRMRSFATIVLMCTSCMGDDFGFFHDVQTSLKFRGLSKNGLSMLTKLGIGKPVSTFLQTEKEQKQHASTQHHMQTCMWVDNYSKMLAVQLPKNQRTFNEALWTVAVAKHHPLHSDIVLPRSNDFLVEIVANLPSKHEFVFQQNTVTDMKLVHKYKVKLVPLKPDVKQVKDLHGVDNRMHLALLHNVGAPRHLFPMSLFEFNIGSNIGMLRTMIHIKHTIRHNNIQFVVCDCNTFWRMIKVLKTWTLRPRAVIIRQMFLHVFSKSIIQNVISCSMFFFFVSG